MKNFIIFILTFCSFLPVSAQMITGGVEYSVEQARNSVLKNISKPIDYNLIQKNFIDKNRKENLINILKGSTELNDRTLAYFSDGSYGVNYNDDKIHVWYYKNDGTLMYIEEKTAIDYPYKTYKYTPSGDLVNMSLRISEEETFIFNKSGKLIAHWVGENCYDEQDNIIMTRKILK